MRAIEKIRQRREAQAEDRPCYSPPSAENRAEAARLINLVESREAPPDEAAIGRETVRRVRRALRTLNFDQGRVARLVMHDCRDPPNRGMFWTFAGMGAGRLGKHQARPADAA